ncbi:hypothetical protein LPW26_21780 [Rhodopseudomonas sp. HC1]|uniref:hypothetical protein n=1 Tax=Rhodopseudomonas infernalis TaxID=2897386 RepID=UPI001EE78A65|nr:hypothetical protein [Rhodopseudomonas infernalis]MCG6207285.1 hypothetical protein [Rhodopseudomonas infernalis]
MMRKFLIAAAFAAATPVAAEAAPLIVSTAAPQAAAARVIEPVACVRGGWRGPGVYPGCGPVRRYYRPYPYVVAPMAPVYGAPRLVVAAPVVPAPRCWIAGAWRLC